MQLARSRRAAKHCGTGANWPIDSTHHSKASRTIRIRRVAYGDAKRPEVYGHAITQRLLPRAALPDTHDIG
jgi:hypothetical protein